MKKTEKTILELFPNLHTKTTITVTTIMTVLTFLICESGLI